MPITKTKRGWKIENVAGHSKTKKDAQERLAAIKISQKNKRGKK